MDGAKECSPNPNGCGQTIRFSEGATIFSQCDGGAGADILRNILLRLPRDSLLASRLVSTSWLHVTSDPSFIRSYRSLRPSMLGFFYHRFGEERPVFVPTARSHDLKEAIHHGSFTLDFLPHQSLRLVDSCSGLLLLADSTKDHYYVCSLLTKECVKIPTPASAKRDTRILIGLTCSENPFHFQIRLVMQADPQPEVATFSSDTRKWRIVRHIDPRSLYWKLDLGAIYIKKLKTQTLPVFVGGVLYWLNGEYKVLAYNEKRSDFAFVELDLPEGMRTFPYNNACLGKAEGRLCYALVNPTHLCIWVLGGDYPKLRWTLEHQIEWGPQLLSEIQDYDSNPPPMILSIGGRETKATSVRLNMRSFISNIVRPIGFHCSNRNIMFLSIRKKAFSYHLQTKELKEICSVDRDAITLIFPCEMPEFHVPLLGTTAEKYSSGH